MISFKTKLPLLLFSLLASAAMRAEDLDPISANDVIWTTPGKNSSDSMPLGNGELGINLWVEENGDMLFYLGRNDTFSEVSQLCKAGMVRVSLSPNPFLAGTPFRQQLKLREGVCGITAGAPGKEVSLKVFVDSASPVVHVLGRSNQPVVITAKVESWRTEAQPVPGESAWTLANGPHTLTQSADVFPKAGKNSVSWYHRNENAFAFEETVRVQSLETIRDTLKDPLLHRTFGGWITGSGFQSTDDRIISTPQPVRDFHLRVASPSEQTPTADAWLKSAESIAKAAEDGPGALARTTASWRAFWDRSWVNCGAGAGSDVPMNSHTVRIGVDSAGGNRFGGSIGSINLLDGVISAAEIARLAKLEPQTKTPGTLDAPSFKRGLSIEGWIKPDSGGAARIIDKVTAGVDDGFLFDIQPNGKLRVIVGSATLMSPPPSILNSRAWRSTWMARWWQSRHPCSRPIAPT